MRYVASREEMQDIDAYSINNVGSFWREYRQIAGC